MSPLYYVMVRSVRDFFHLVLTVTNVSVRHAGSYYVLPVGYVRRSQVCCLTYLMHCSALSRSSDDGRCEVDEILAVN